MLISIIHINNNIKNIFYIRINILLIVKIFFVFANVRKSNVDFFTSDLYK